MRAARWSCARRNGDANSSCAAGGVCRSSCLSCQGRSRPSPRVAPPRPSPSTSRACAQTPPLGAPATLPSHRPSRGTDRRTALCTPTWAGRSRSTPSACATQPSTVCTSVPSWVHSAQGRRCTTTRAIGTCSSMVSSSGSSHRPPTPYSMPTITRPHLLSEEAGWRRRWGALMARSTPTHRHAATASSVRAMWFSCRAGGHTPR
mmetsp:Transcript_16307/g.36536  ORF Transcript_16307/g.36536 Transcript_16307/m.36536 type:complete len:204 (+) Transcript_16307:173-784(+)